MLAHISVAELADRELEPLAMHRTHHRLLYFCAQCPGRTVGDAVRALRLTPQAVQTPMRMLIKKGWIEQRRCEVDGRQRKLYLTPSGHDMNNRLAKEQFQLFSEVRKRVGERNFKGFLTTLRALVSDIDLDLFNEQPDNLP